MKVVKKQNSEKNDIEILIEYPILTPIIDKLCAVIRAVDCKVTCIDEKKELFVHASDIYYIESVDKKSFVYLKEEVYRTEQRLYKIEEFLQGLSFVKISKSVILNINMLQSIKPLFNSRLEALLTNGEKLNISRKYLREIKNKLEKL